SEKSWGPNYLHMGLTLSTTFQGTSAFNLNVDHRMTWLNDRGLEWRNRAYLGNLSGLASELYQPLDLGRQWFVAPRIVAAQDLDNMFIADNAAAQYRNRRGEAASDLGYSFGTVGEARLGYEFGNVSFTKATGAAVFPDQHDQIGMAYVHVLLDQFDNWFF